MADEFPNFSLGIIQGLEELYFLYDSDNYKKTNFFKTAVDFEVVNVTDKIDKGTIKLKPTVAPKQTNRDL